MSNLNGGGIERVNLLLMRELLRLGYRIDLVLVRKTGEFANQVPDGVTVFVLDKSRALDAVIPLASYLRRKRPDVMFTAIPTVNVLGIVATILAGMHTKVIPTEHMPVSVDQRENPQLAPRIAYRFYPLLYLLVESVVVISEESGRDFVARYRNRIDPAKVHMIYNPAVSDDLSDLASRDPQVDWLRDGQNTKPVILGVGRLTRQKNFPLLIRAFAEVRRHLDARLVILGNGEDRGELEHLTRELAIERHVRLPGFADNPYTCISRASVFVLSSRYETLPTVLIEALACGTPVVATDCIGTREILENGRHGEIVSEQTPVALAEAILRTVVRRRSRIAGMTRAQTFSARVAGERYAALIESATS